MGTMNPEGATRLMTAGRRYERCRVCRWSSLSHDYVRNVGRICQDCWDRRRVLTAPTRFAVRR